MSEVTVTNNPDKQRYEAHREEALVGFAAYRVSDELVVLTHTEVDPEQEGEGVGSALARGALDDVRDQGCKVQARCPFIASWIDRHPDYADLLG